MKSLLIWILTALLFTAVGGVVGFAILQAHEKSEPAEPKKEEHPAAESQPGAAEKKKEERLSHDQAGNVVVFLDKEGQERMGVEVQEKGLEQAELPREITGYGMLQEDPARVFTVRAPLPGVLQVRPSDHWPTLGEVLAPDTVIGAVKPRLSPGEYADLNARLVTARAEVQQAETSLKAMQTALEAKLKANEKGETFSNQVLQEAQAQIEVQKSKLEGARETARILEEFTAGAQHGESAAPGPGSSVRSPTEFFALKAGPGGRVIEMPVAPNEAVESGQVILKVSRFDRLLARVSLPAGEHRGGQATKARLEVGGHELTAERIGIAPAADTVTGGQAFLFAVELNAEAGQRVQPGLPVIAHLQLPGEAQKGVWIPRSAIVRFGGRTWAYIRAAEEEFTRREIPLEASGPEARLRMTPRADHPDTHPAEPTGTQPAEASIREDWFVARGFQPGEPVVIKGAQALLSQELKFSTQEQEE